jgi:poly(hydroxyalkanoate) depolymerase family esterase
MMKFKLPNLDLMRTATALLKTQGAHAATAAIQRAIGGAIAATPEARPMRDINPSPKPLNPGASSTSSETPAFVAELLAELGTYADVARRTGANLNSGTAEPVAKSDAAVAVSPAAGSPAAGNFLPGSFTNDAGTRDYKLYLPQSYNGESLPLIVMLHGCTQNPDDFAAGTRMNAIADERRCLVLYPAQAKSANVAGCWNWFQNGDQQRDHGEPSIIAGMTRDVIARYGADAEQVYVAGLSAGGAMALIMGTVYPDLFTAVGVHSGLPYASARDLPSALAAMRGQHSPAQQIADSRPVPIIVFHGDKDQTVNAGNAKHIMQQWSAGQVAVLSTHASTDEKERVFVKSSTKDQDGYVLAEEWTIQGAGHAWSGGSSSGSYTDQRGPDASREMVRFFFTHPKRGRRVA